MDAWMDHILAPFLAPVLGSAWFFEVGLDDDRFILCYWLKDNDMDDHERRCC